MTYKEARNFINQSNQYGSKLGLESITELLNRLDNPQNRLKVIHVAGTNGKGSTSAFLATILSVQGYRVGRYNSPAVFDYLEMIQINCGACHTPGKAEYLSEEGVIKTIEIIAPICSEMVHDGFSHPTTFEIETAMALLYLYWEKVDFAVIEVGLGGRLDATNVFANPICNIITSISKDHMQYLGDTLHEIAYEKAGIIKKDAKVITCNTNAEILDVIQQECKTQSNSLIISDIEKVSNIHYSSGLTSFVYHEKEYQIRLLGEYQIKNAIVAIDTVNQLQELGYPVKGSSIKEGLLKTVWGGRFEILAHNPYFIIDGAHNEDAALQLRASILRYYPEQRKLFILGVLADKDYSKILELTADMASVILTVTPNNDRALPSSLLAKESKQYTKGEVIDAGSVDKAVKLAYDMAKDEDIIIAFGSLSYLSEVRTNIIQRIR